MHISLNSLGPYFLMAEKHELHIFNSIFDNERKGSERNILLIRLYICQNLVRLIFLGKGILKSSLHKEKQQFLDRMLWMSPNCTNISKDL